MKVKWRHKMLFVLEMINLCVDSTVANLAVYFGCVYISQTDVWLNNFAIIVLVTSWTGESLEDSRASTVNYCLPIIIT